MRSKAILATFGSVASVALVVLISQPSNAASGDNCSIDLKNGLKEPGTEQANGDCKSDIDGKTYKKGKDGGYNKTAGTGGSTNTKQPVTGAKSPASAGVNKGPSGGGTTNLEKRGGKH